MTKNILITLALLFSLTASAAQKASAKSKEAAPELKSEDLLQTAKSETSATAPESTTAPLIEQGMLLKLQDPLEKPEASDWQFKTGFGLSASNTSSNITNDFGEKLDGSQVNGLAKPELRFSVTRLLPARFQIEAQARGQFTAKSLEVISANGTSSRATISSSAIGGRLMLMRSVTDKLIVGAGSEWTTSQIRQTSNNRFLAAQANETATWGELTGYYLITSAWSADLSYLIRTTSAQQEYNTGNQQWNLGVTRTW